MCLRPVVRSLIKLQDENGVTLSVGPLGKVDAYLIERSRPKPSGPAPSNHAPEAWRRHIDDYLVTLVAAGQRPKTLRLRKALLCRTARGVGCPPAEVTVEKLVNWLGKQQQLSPEGRKSYRSTLRGFFAWMYETGRVPKYLGDALPKVSVPHASPRPTSDQAWEAAMSKADRRTELMLRFAAECGLRRAEVAQVHSRDLMDVGYP
jgi:integrase